MERLFLTVVQMGISFSGLLLAAAGLRLVLKKAPKNMICLLWMVVGIRLLCPFNIVTDFGLLPGSDVILEKYEVWKAPADADLQHQLSEAQQTELSNVPSESKEAQADTPATTSLTKKASVSWVLTAAAWIWFAGVLGMCAYLAVGLSRVVSRRQFRLSGMGFVFTSAARSRHRFYLVWRRLGSMCRFLYPGRSFLLY